MSGGSVPKNLVSFFTLEGLERAGSSESLINGWDCDLTIAILVCVLSAAISPLMFSISCEYLIVVSFGNSDSLFHLFYSLSYSLRSFVVEFGLTTIIRYDIKIERICIEYRFNIDKKLDKINFFSLKNNYK